MSLRERKKKKDSAPMPATGAGLMRYYDEDLPGFKIGPGVVITYTVVLIVGVLILKAGLLTLF